MRHILIISFDEVPRVVSNAYHLMERSLQLIKQIYSDSVVDYYDLLQEEVTVEIADRFLAADKVIFVFSAKDVNHIPAVYLRAFDRLQHYLGSCSLPEESLLVLIDKPYAFAHDLKNMLEEAFKRTAKFISEEKLLTKEFFPLQEQASS